MVPISTPLLVLYNPGLTGRISEFKTRTKTMSSVDKNENDLSDSKQKIVHGKVHGKQTRGELQYSFSESDLALALHSLAQRVEEAHGIQVDCIGDGILKSLPKDMHVLFFRTIRELLMNVVRHANARHATISISREESQIPINGVDDSIGFNTTGLTRKLQKNEEIVLSQGLGSESDKYSSLKVELS